MPRERVPCSLIPLTDPFHSPGRQYWSADLVDTVRVEGDVILDLRHRFKRCLVSPHRIDGAIPAGRNAVVGSVALVRAIRRVLAARERGHIDIPTGDILNGRIGRLTKRQRIACIGDNFFADFDHHARPVRIDRNGVVGSRNLYLLVSHELYPSVLETVRSRSGSPFTGRKLRSRTGRKVWTSVAGHWVGLNSTDRESLVTSFGAFVAFRHVCRKPTGEGQHLSRFARNVRADIPRVGAREESIARHLEHLRPPGFLRGGRCLKPRPIALSNVVQQLNDPAALKLCASRPVGESVRALRTIDEEKIRKARCCHSEMSLNALRPLLL